MVGWISQGFKSVFNNFFNVSMLQPVWDAIVNNKPFFTKQVFLNTYIQSLKMLGVPGFLVEGIKVVMRLLMRQYQNYGLSQQQLSRKKRQQFQKQLSKSWKDVPGTPYATMKYEQIKKRRRILWQNGLQDQYKDWKQVQNHRKYQNGGLSVRIRDWFGATKQWTPQQVSIFKQHEALQEFDDNQRAKKKTLTPEQKKKAEELANSTAEKINKSTIKQEQKKSSLKPKPNLRVGDQPNMFRQGNAIQTLKNGFNWLLSPFSSQQQNMQVQYEDTKLSKLLKQSQSNLRQRERIQRQLKENQQKYQRLVEQNYN